MAAVNRTMGPLLELFTVQLDSTVLWTHYFLLDVAAELHTYKVMEERNAGSRHITPYYLPLFSHVRLSSSVSSSSSVTLHPCMEATLLWPYVRLSSPGSSSASS